MKDGVQQGSVLSPFLPVTMREAWTCDVRKGLPWEILHADDLVLAAESIDALRERVLQGC